LRSRVAVSSPSTGIRLSELDDGVRSLPVKGGLAGAPDLLAEDSAARLNVRFHPDVEAEVLGGAAL
jgi:hypothetical protein